MVRYTATFCWQACPPSTLPQWVVAHIYAITKNGLSYNTLDLTQNGLSLAIDKDGPSKLTCPHAQEWAFI